MKDSRSNEAGSISVDFLESLTDEIKVSSYLIQCIGCSIAHTGVPSDPEVVHMACAEVAFHLDKAAEALETAMCDLMDDDTEEDEEE